MLVMNTKGDIFSERRKNERRKTDKKVEDERRSEDRRKKDINAPKAKDRKVNEF